MFSKVARSTHSSARENSYDVARPKVPFCVGWVGWVEVGFGLLGWLQVTPRSFFDSFYWFRNDWVCKIIATPHNQMGKLSHIPLWGFSRSEHSLDGNNSDSSGATMTLGLSFWQLPWLSSFTVPVVEALFRWVSFYKYGLTIHCHFYAARTRSRRCTHPRSESNVVRAESRHSTRHHATSLSDCMAAHHSASQYITLHQTSRQP